MHKKSHKGKDPLWVNGLKTMVHLFSKQVLMKLNLIGAQSLTKKNSKLFVTSNTDREQGYFAGISKPHE